MEINSPIKLSIMLYAIGILIIGIGKLISHYFNYQLMIAIPSWALITPAITGAIYAKKYKKPIPRPLRKSTAYYVFYLQLVITFILFGLGTIDTVLLLISFIINVFISFIIYVNLGVSSKAALVS